MSRGKKALSPEAQAALAKVQAPKVEEPVEGAVEGQDEGQDEGSELGTLTVNIVDPEPTPPPRMSKQTLAEIEAGRRALQKHASHREAE